MSNTEALNPGARVKYTGREFFTKRGEGRVYANQISVMTGEVRVEWSAKSIGIESVPMTSVERI